MNKLRPILAAILLTAILMLSACGGSDPVPQELTREPSPNHLGMRFSFTLGQFSERLQKTLSSLEDADAPTMNTEGWQIVAEDLVDDSGMAYASYCNRQPSATFTAAVEDESEKLMNVGVGCYASQLMSEDSRDSFLSVAAATAQIIGGFADDGRPFLMELIGDLLGGEEDERVYEGVCCSVSRDEGSVMVILSPMNTAEEGKTDE